MTTALVFTQYGGPEVQETAEVPDPTPGPSELLVQVHAAGVNPVDVKLRQGAMDDGTRSFPSVMGLEAAGVVLEVGDDVDGFSVGDRVLGATAPGHGSLAGLTVLSAAQAAVLPVQVGFTDGATLPVAAATALDALEQLGLPEGSTVLVNGASGGVGTAAAQIARDLGLTVVGTASEANRAHVEALGAVFVEYGPDVETRVRELLPTGVDGVLDLAGGDSLRAVAPLASSPASVVSCVDPAAAQEVGGAFVQRSWSGQTLVRLAAMVADGRLDPGVTDTVPFERAAEAVAAVEAGARGKVVVTLV